MVKQKINTPINWIMQSEEYFKYLRKFDYVFKTNLGYESGAT